MFTNITVTNLKIEEIIFINNSSSHTHRLGKYNYHSISVKLSNHAFLS